MSGASNTDSFDETLTQLTAAQAAAASGIFRGASVLTRAVDDGGILTLDGKALTPMRIEQALETGITARDAQPIRTSVQCAGDDDETLRAGKSIHLVVETRTPSGYCGALTRTFVVDSDGGKERRGQVALSHAFRSVESLLTTGTQTVAAVKLDLEAEIRAFGFDSTDVIETAVSGIGREPREPPLEAEDEITAPMVIRVEAGVGTDSTRVTNGDCLVCTEDRTHWLESVPRSLSPHAYPNITC